MKIEPRENFGELFRFFTKGLMHLKIQTKFKSCLLPEFVIHNPFGICIFPEREVVPFYLFCHSQSLVNFRVREGSFINLQNPIRREKSSKV
jgi:hypothetical protein